MTDDEFTRVRDHAMRQAIELACNLYLFRNPTDDAGIKVFRQILEQTLMVEMRRPTEEKEGEK